MAQLAELLRMQLTANDLCGRFGGNGFLILLERGTARDVETWAENVVKRVDDHTFSFDEKNLVGHGHGGSGAPAAGQSRRRARRSPMRSTPTRRGRELGGNQMYAVDKSDTDTRVQAYDKIWVKHIKSALMENRFRLVQQPIASLLGEDKGMFDVLVRMLDEQGNEVLPAEFIARRRAQRPDEEHRPLGHRRLDVLRREPQGRLHLRAPVQGHDARQEPDRLARDAAANR